MHKLNAISQTATPSPRVSPMEPRQGVQSETPHERAMREEAHADTAHAPQHARLQPIALTLPEVAALLQVCTATVRNLIDTGKLKGMHIGRSWRVRYVEVIAFCKRREEESSR